MDENGTTAVIKMMDMMINFLSITLSKYFATDYFYPENKK